MQVLVLFFLAFVATAQDTWFPVTAGDVTQKSSGAPGYFKYTATINEASVGSPARLAVTLSPTLNGYRVSLSTCFPGNGSPLASDVCAAGVECVLNMPPCIPGPPVRDAYVYQQDYYLTVESLEALNFTVADEVVNVIQMTDSYSGSVTIDNAIRAAPAAYAVFEYNRANLDDLSQFVLSANGFSYSVSFTDDVTNICAAQLSEPNSNTARTKVYLETAVGGCPLPGSGTRYLALQSGTTGANTVDVWAVQDTARSTSGQIVELVTNTRVALAWANAARPFAFAHFQLPADRYVTLTLENPLVNANCRVYYAKDNAGPVPTPNTGLGCTPLRVSVTAGNTGDLSFSPCDAGNWYLTVTCDRAESDANGNGFYITLGDNQTSTQAIGTAADLKFAVTGSYTTQNQLIAFADNLTEGSVNTLPDGTLDKLVKFRFNDMRTSGGGNYRVYLARNTPADSNYEQCQDGNSLSFSRRTTSGRTYFPCSSAPNAGTLYGNVEGPAVANYEISATTFGPTVLARDATVNGVIDDQSYVHFEVDLGATTTMTIFTPTTSSGSLDLSAYTPTTCGAPRLYRTQRGGQAVVFCWDSIVSTSWPSNSYLLGSSNANNNLDNTFSVQSASYEIGSSLRTAWTDLATPVELTFDGSTSNNWVRTLEWDNQFEGFKITMTATSSVQLSVNFFVLDGCTEVYSSSTSWASINEIQFFGTASLGFPGTLSSPTIRLFIEQQSNNAGANISFAYESQGNCMDSATVATSAIFCGSTIVTGTNYNFGSSNQVDTADAAANLAYTNARQNFNASEVSTTCLNDLQTWACENYFRPCQASGDVDKTPCSDICNTIKNSCPSSSCFDAECVTASCSSGTQLVVGLSFLLATILALVF